MGLSASQARLLNLTRRMHDIEYKAQNLEAQKLQMANESKAVYTEYENALNKQKVQFKKIGADGAATYQDASLQTLLQAGYKIKILAGNTWYNFKGTETNDKYTNLGSKWVEDKEGATDLAVDNNIEVPSLDSAAVGDIIQANDGTMVELSEAVTTASTTKVNGYKLDDARYSLSQIDFNDETTLRNLVEAGFIVFEKPTRETDEDGKTIYEEVNIATDTNLQEVSDEILLKKAEAKYEADMRKIDAKDKKFDTDLAAMDAERNAIKTEMETLKSIAKDNVDRTFKLFS